MSVLHGLALLSRLPRARGALTPMRALDDLTWLRVGGPAEVLFQPEDEADLGDFLATLASDIPVTILGVGSNVIIRDGGVPGVSIRLGRGFTAIRREGGTGLRVGAAMLDAQLAKAAASYGVAGFEFLRGVPGAVGGAVRMNAGCYGSYVADIFTGAVALDRQGRRHALEPADMTFGYRDCGLPDDWIVVEASFEGRADAPEAILARMEALMARRAATQPIRERSAGSTFRNPVGYSSTGRADDTHDMKAWSLIDRAGCRGLRLGGAQVSALHPNFLINTGEATAADIENLGEIVRSKVLEIMKVQLEWEIKRIGLNPADAVEG